DEDIATADTIQEQAVRPRIEVHRSFEGARDIHKAIPSHDVMAIVATASSEAESPAKFPTRIDPVFQLHHAQACRFVNRLLLGEAFLDPAIPLCVFHHVPHVCMYQMLMTIWRSCLDVIR